MAQKSCRVNFLTNLKSVHKQTYSYTHPYTNRQMHKSINLHTHKTSHRVKLSCELQGVHYCTSPPRCTRVKCVHTQELLWPQAQCQNHCTSKIFPSFGKIFLKSVRLLEGWGDQKDCHNSIEHGMLHLVNHDQFVNIN